MKKWFSLIGLICVLAPAMVLAYQIGDQLMAEMVVYGEIGPIPPPPDLAWRWETTGSAARIVGDATGQTVLVELVGGGQATVRFVAERGRETWTRSGTFQVIAPTPVPTAGPVIIKNIGLNIKPVAK